MNILLPFIKKNKLITLALALTVAVSACSSAPSHIIIAPQLMNVSSLKYSNKQADFNVIDNRVASHIVQILKENQAAQLFSSQEHLQDTINTKLSQAFKKQGLVLIPNANTSTAMNKLTIYIDAALISVQQDTLKYKANNEITLRAVVENKEQTLTKTFTTRGNSNGPLTADIAVLERDFNQQIGKVLTQILNNTELKAAIK